RRSFMDYPTQPSTATQVVTGFGTVMVDRITFFLKKGWFSGGAQEDIPIRHVTSVRLESRRYVFWAIVFGLAGVVSIIQVGNSPGAAVAGLVLLAIALLFLWGSPKVVLSAAGGETRIAVGWPWTKGDAERFVSALRAELFKQERH